MLSADDDFLQFTHVSRPPFLEAQVPLCGKRTARRSKNKKIWTRPCSGATPAMKPAMLQLAWGDAQDVLNGSKVMLRVRIISSKHHRCALHIDALLILHSQAQSLVKVRGSPPNCVAKNFLSVPGESERSRTTLSVLQGFRWFLQAAG